MSDKNSKVKPKSKSRRRGYERKLAKYRPVVRPKKPHPKGLFALKAAHGEKLTVTCLFCKGKLPERKGSAGGRKPFLCKKKACFKAMRCAYRYDWEHDKLKKPLPKKPKAVMKKAA